MTHRLINRVVEEARLVGALVNAAMSKVSTRFHQYGDHYGAIAWDHHMGLSLGGASPALLTHLQHQIDTVIGPEYETLSAWMAKLALLRETGVISNGLGCTLASGDRIASIHRILLRRGNTTAARQLFRSDYPRGT